jgi:hypothetical protein
VWFAQDPVPSASGTEVTLSTEVAALPEISGMGNVLSLRQAMEQDTSGDLVDLVEAFAAETDPNDRVRIPAQAGHQFRAMPVHDSGACRATVPAMPGHPLRGVFL